LRDGCRTSTDGRGHSGFKEIQLCQYIFADIPLKATHNDILYCGRSALLAHFPRYTNTLRDSLLSGLAALDWLGFFFLIRSITLFWVSPSTPRFSSRVCAYSLRIPHSFRRQWDILLHGRRESLKTRVAAPTPQVGPSWRCHGVCFLPLDRQSGFR
jgi:hypothetical protein